MFKLLDEPSKIRMIEPLRRLHSKMIGDEKLQVLEKGDTRVQRVSLVRV
jgi:hypothetical protein